MQAPWSDVRPEERATTGRAFLVLLLITAGHTLSETARDALFLSRISASRLPWVYLGLAAVGALIGMRPRAPASPRRLAISLIASAGVTAVFGVLLHGPSSVLVYALYFWTGVFASVVTVELWVLLGKLHTATEAKRLYGLIGGGSVLGAVVGAGLSRALALKLAPAPMLFASAVLIALSAPVALSLPAAATEAVRGPPRGAALGAGLGRVWAAPYPKRVLTLTLVGAVAVTVADFAFKSVVAASVPKERLVAYLSTVALGLSTLSLITQVGLSRWLLRRLGVRAALLLLPIGMLAGGVGVALGGGLRGVLALKGADGAFRYSVHRTGLELLMVPVHDAVRERVKPLIDLVGQRGGQAFASLVILGLGVLGAHERHLGLVVVAFSALWILAAIAVYSHYLDLFRTTLREGGISTQTEMPELDVGALETLLVGLNSMNDGEVVGALDLLAVQGKERLIPPLILYHPSQTVVLRALELFVELKRPDFVPIADRLYDHPDRGVAAAALRARTVVAPDPDLLLARLANGPAEVRAAAAVALAARSLVSTTRARELFAQLAGEGPAVRVELARSIRYECALVDEQLPKEIGFAFDELLVALASDEDSATQVEVARAMGRRGSRVFLGPLTAMLEEHSLRAVARAAIGGISGAGPHLERALADEGLPLPVRIHIPRTLCALPPDEAAPLLIKHLGGETDGTVRFKILRALRRLRREHPTLKIDEKPLVASLDDNLTRGRAHARARAALQRGASEHPSAARELLVELLFDKEVYVLERVCSIFDLLEPKEDFLRIFRGVRSLSPRFRSSSRELLETVLRAPHKERVLALVDDVSGDGAPTATSAADARSFDEVVRELASDRDALVATLAAYFATEAGLELDDASRELARATARGTLFGEDFLDAPMSRRAGGVTPT